MKLFADKSFIYFFLPRFFANSEPGPILVDENGNQITGAEYEAFVSQASNATYYSSSGFRDMGTTEHEKDPNDFKGDDIINHSAELVNARFSIVDHYDTGKETTSSVGAYNTMYKASNAINGEVRRDDYSDSVVTRSGHRATDNWFADITNGPSISFVKIHLGYYNRYMAHMRYPTWGFHWTFRTFINDVECYAIQYYSDELILTMWENYEPMIFSCPSIVSNANKIRISTGTYGEHSNPVYMFFSEVEIFEADDCPVKENEMCGDAQEHNADKCTRHTCGPQGKNEQRCSATKCACISSKTETLIGYDVAKCKCPSEWGGKHCETYIGSPPCEEKNPCNSDGGSTHTCINVRDDENGKWDFKCYCKNGYSGTTCDTEPPCNGPMCKGSGDVHYSTFDGPAGGRYYYDNMGFCKYILTTNGACQLSWPLDTSGFNFKADDADQDFFLVAADQDHLPGDTSYGRAISRLVGLQIYWRPRSNGVLFRLTTKNGMDGWLWEVDVGFSGRNWHTLNDPDSTGNPKLIKSNTNFYSTTMNLNFALRTTGGNNNILYIGAGTVTGDSTWKDSPSANVRDYLLKVSFNKGHYGYVQIQANCELKRDVCGICGNFDNAKDFSDSYNQIGVSDRKEWERVLERRHFFDHSRIPDENGHAKCGFTNKDNTPVPTEELSLRNSRRKRNTADADNCDGDFNTIKAECEKLVIVSTFHPCDLDTTQKVQSCIFDACIVPSDLAGFTCGIMEAHVQECNASGKESNKIRSWRTADLCPKPCGANQHFEGCTSYSCWATTTSCTVDQNECDASTQCIEGCFCDAGFIMDGTTCVVDDGNQCQEAAAAATQNAAATSVPCASAPCENGGTCEHEYDSNANIVGYNCDCMNGYTGEHCEIKLTVDNTAELLAQVLPDDKTIEIDDFLTHGCFCSRLDGQVTRNGPPVSPLDKICQRLTMCEMCSANIECGTQHGFPFYIASGANGPICDNGSNNACQQAQCVCSMGMVDAMIDYIDVQNIEEVDYEPCVEKTGSGRDVECCGEADKWMRFPTNADLVCEIDAGVPTLVEESTGLPKKRFDDL